MLAPAVSSSNDTIKPQMYDGGALIEEQTQPENTSAESNWQNPADTEISFKKTVHDFGKIVDGETISTLFVFTNTGKNPLEIDVVSACFCISTQYTRDLIQPGEMANLDVTFDSNDQVGLVKKDIDIIFKNTDKDGYPLIKRVTLKGKVLPKKD